MKRKKSPDNTTGEISFKCSECSKEFRTSGGLAGHLWITHSINRGRKKELQQLREKIKEFEGCIPKGAMVECPKCENAYWAYDLKVING
jgi:uncharacterized C2H2 Zn-finger protein